MKLSDDTPKDLRRYAVSMVDLAFIRHDLTSLLDEVEEGRRGVEIGEKDKSGKFNEACDSYICPSCQKDLILKHTLIKHYSFRHCPDCGVKLVWV